MKQHQVLILGGGIAALSCAAALSERGITDIGVYADAYGGSPWVYVELRDIRLKTLKAYPWFYIRMKNAGCDPAKELVEVVPQAHSFSGGVRVDANCRATIPGLYAIGEAAGGFHGACRIGGNAASQAVISALLCAEAIAADDREACDFGDTTPVWAEDAETAAAWSPRLKHFAARALGAYRDGRRWRTPHGLWKKCSPAGAWAPTPPRRTVPLCC